MSMPITAIPELRCDMACSLSSVPQASFLRWRGWSTAGPSHYRTSARLGLMRAPRAGDLLHRAHPVVDVAIFGLDHDVIGAGVAIGAKPCAQLGRVLTIEARAQWGGEGRVLPSRARIA